MSQSSSYSITPWLTCYLPRPEAGIRLFCFPHGGGGPQSYKNWAEKLPETIEVFSLNFPGRGSRRREPAIHDMEKLAESITEAVSSYIDKPFAFFGHSVGALVAYETAGKMKEKGLPSPVRLLVSAHKVPHESRETDPMYNLSDEELVEKIIELGLVPEETLENRELVDFILPPLKADFEVSETYSFKGRDPLETSITALGGKKDPLLTPEDLKNWDSYTKGNFTWKVFDGDHFYTESHTKILLDEISRLLAEDLKNIPKAVMEGPKSDYPEKCLHELFREQAAAHPGRIALADPSSSLTFRELDEKTDLLARYLQKNGVVVDSIAGIYMESSVEYVIAYLAILKAGGAYMPVELAYPEELLKRILAKADPVVILTKKELLGNLPGDRRGIERALPLDSGWEEVLGNMELPELDKDRELPGPDSLAYCVMTSGTTGEPKGIICPHRGAVNSYYWRYRNVPYQEGEREGCNVFLVWEVIRPLLQGYPSYIIPDDVIYDPWKLVDFLEEYEITRVLFTPSLLEQVFNTPNLELSKRLSKLKVVWLNGEVVPTALRDRFFNILPGVKLLNDYSISECHDVCTHDLEKLDPLFSPKYASLGFPMDNVRIYLLDENLEPVPLGMSAEIYVGGDTLARGYLDDPEKTDERFIPDPLRNDGSRLFRTGDLGRFLPNGELEVKGRVEFMIKLRGYSIVPGSVEAAITEHEAVNTSVVVTIDSKETGQPEALAAYVVSDGSIDEKELEKSLRSHLKERLPHYSIPSYFISLKELPLHDVTGKLDRKKLPDPVSSVRKKTTNSKSSLGRSQIEGVIIDVWEEILNVRAGDINDNFFDLGGHSLLAINICDKLSGILGVDVSVIDIYENPTVKTMAEFISSRREKAGLGTVSVVSGERSFHSGSSTEIAVVGMAARFPGASSVGEFWNNLKEGVCSIRELTDEELERNGISRDIYSDEDYRKVGALLDDVDLFDYSFFGLSKKEADLMDPQHRLFLECCWEAMENAGYPPSANGENTGVFGGCYSPLYLLHNLKGGGFMDPSDPSEYHLTETGNDKDYLATRVSYMLNLQGPSVTVQTSCSTAASVVASACQSLLAGKCDTALAGASSITFPQGGYQYVEGHINSREGKVKTFDARADGTILGDGVGVLVLKRLEDALEAGDNIVSVIKGYAVNNDGNNKAGYSAPSVHGQKSMVKEALDMAGIGAESISYMEAHGTGTLIGDPIEIRALTDVYRSYTDEKSFCALGSVKPNIGHSNIASGMAGIMKTSLSLYNRQIPPTINYQTPNPAMNIDDSPFFVNTELRDWETVNGVPRRAGVSCLGIGGTNCHFIMEEPPVSEKAEENESNEDRKKHFILPLSAGSTEALDGMRHDLSSFLEKNRDINLTDLEYTLQEGRDELSVRMTVPCKDIDTALEELKTARIFNTREKKIDSESKTAFLFPGQGSQHNRMGMELYETEPVYRKYFDLCCHKLTDIIGVDLRDLLFAEPGSPEAEEAFKYAYYIQPAIFTLQYSLAKTLMDWGIVPEYMVGHSIGEYAAACLSGIMILDDTLKLVALRGRVMEEAGEGAMTAAGMNAKDADKFLKGRNDISVAVVNSDDQAVLSGTVEAIGAAEEELKNMGIVCRRVNVKQAFHSAMMDVPAEKLVREAEKITLGKPEIPVLSNLTGTWLTDEEAVDPSYWGRHMRGTVRFSDNVKVLLKENPQVLMEVGSHKILGKLLKSQTRDLSLMEKPVIISCLRHPMDKKTGDWLAFDQAMGELWGSGFSYDWKAFRGKRSGRKIPVPGIRFDRKRCWKQAETGLKSPTESRDKIMDIAERGYIPSWKRSVLTGKSIAPGRGKCVVFAQEDKSPGLDSGLTELLNEKFEITEKVFVSDNGKFSKNDEAYRIDPVNSEHYKKLFEDLANNNHYPDRIVYLWGLDDSSGGDYLENSYYRVLALAQGAASQSSLDPLGIWIVTDKTFQIDREETEPLKSTIQGPAMVLAQEYPHITCRIIDVQPGSISSGKLARQIAGECLLEAADREPFTVLRGNNRWVRTCEPVSLVKTDPAVSSFMDKGVYIISGGFGRIGRVLCEKLAGPDKTLVITSRMELPDRGEWNELLKNSRSNERIRAGIEQITGLEEKGCKVVYKRTDFGVQADVSELVEYAVKEFGYITGIFHAAGVANLKPLNEITRKISEAEFSSKIRGVLNLEKAVSSLGAGETDPDFIMLFSSMASILGGYNMTAYTAANNFMDSFACTRPPEGKTSWISVNWDDWDFEYTKEQVGAYEKTAARYAMSPEEGFETIKRIVKINDPVQVMVATRPVIPRMEKWIHQIEKGENSFDGAGVTAEKGLQISKAGLADRIIEIFRQVLGVDDLLPEDNFFDAGGDSLLASQILLKLRRGLKEHSHKISLNSIFDYPSVRELAGWLETT